MKPNTVTRRGFTVRETTEITGLSKLTVHRMIDSGQLRTYRIGRTIRVVAEDVDRITAPGSITPVGVAGPT